MKHVPEDAVLGGFSMGAFRASAARAGADASVHEYYGAGHYYTDETLADYSAGATANTWARVTGLINAAWVTRRSSSSD